MRSLLLFDGLGSHAHGPVAELHRAFRQPGNHAFFEVVGEAVGQVLGQADPALLNRCLPAGFPVRRWLADPSEVAAPAGSESVVAGVMLHIQQLCGLQPTGSGIAPDVVGAIGHSIGLQAAVVAGLRLRRPGEFLAVAASSVQWVLLSLLAAHGAPAAGPPAGSAADDAPAADPDVVRRYLDSAPKARRPTPMASVTGLSRAELDELVRPHLSGRRVTVGLTNTPTAHVLSGTVPELLDLYFAAFARSATSWAFLPNSIPFHSDLLAPAVEQVRSAAGGLAADLPAADRLTMPVYATDTARDLRTATDLPGEYLEQVFVRPIDWPAVVRFAAADSRAELVVDHGPGAAARRFTRECLLDVARPPRFESAQTIAQRSVHPPAQAPAPARSSVP